MGKRAHRGIDPEIDSYSPVSLDNTPKPSIHATWIDIQARTDGRQMFMEQKYKAQGDLPLF